MLLQHVLRHKKQKNRTSQYSFPLFNPKSTYEKKNNQKPKILFLYQYRHQLRHYYCISYCIAYLTSLAELFVQHTCIGKVYL